MATLKSIGAKGVKKITKGTSMDAKAERSVSKLRKAAKKKR